MAYTTDAPYRVRLWYPFTVAYEDATASLEIKAPEEGNTETTARNQTFATTRAGTTLVYDRGRNFNSKRKFEFRDIKANEKVSLEAFLTAVQWGTAKLLYEDWNGDQRIIRITSTELEFIDKGYIGRDSVSQKISTWDFNLEFLDLTDNSDELEGNDAIVTSALTLHLSDYNHPHNPKVTASVTTSAVVVEQFKADDWNAITWLITIVNGANKAYAFMHATNNNVAAGADATAVDTTLESVSDPAGLLAIVTLSVDLNGVGTSQYMRLKAQASSGTYSVSVRRFKL